MIDLYARGNLAKYVACQNAIAIMDRVMEISGGAGYHRRFPIERLYRDVRAGAIMPYSSPDARTLFAQARARHRAGARSTTTPRAGPGSSACSPA